MVIYILVLCVNLEGYSGEGGGFRMEETHVYLWPIHIWQQPSQYCKIITLQLKYINFKKNHKANVLSLQIRQNWKSKSEE